jgi:hypothetical protein
MSSSNPVLDGSSNEVVMTIPAATPNPTEEADDRDPYWFLILVNILIFCTSFSDYLQHYVLLAKDLYIEACESRRLRSPLSATGALTCSSLLKPPSPGAPTTFPLFNCLPLELREMIWVEALPDARLLMLRIPEGIIPALNRANERRRPRIVPRLIHRIFHCGTPPPVLLGVNAESRTVALRHYRLGLAPQGFPEPRIYVDFDRDVVALSDAIMASDEGQNLFRATPDLARARRVCVASGPVGEAFLRRRQVGRVLEGVREAVAVDSALVREGRVPAIAREDWGYWLRWRGRRGEVEWMVGGRGGRWWAVAGRRRALLCLLGRGDWWQFCLDLL